MGSLEQQISHLVVIIDKQSWEESQDRGKTCVLSGELQLSTLSKPDLFDLLHFHNLSLHVGEYLAAPFCPGKPSKSFKTTSARFSAWIRQGHLFRMLFSVVIPPEYFDVDQSIAATSTKPLLSLSWGKTKRLANMVAPWKPTTERVVAFSAEVDVGVVRVGQDESDSKSIVKRTCETKLKLGFVGGPIYKIQSSSFPDNE